MRLLLVSALVFHCIAAFAVELNGSAVQGGLVFGKAEPGTIVTLDGDAIAVSPQGEFVIGFGRDETGTRELRVRSPGAEIFSKDLSVQSRDYAIERVDGLPPSTVTPDPAATERIREDARMVANARRHRDEQAYYSQGFSWPAEGRISGVYGSQRVLNGEPRRPHFGLDIAAPEGTEVRAPADGLITMTHPEMYFSGGTIILDHGQGLSSTFLHLSKILVEAGTFVRQGELIGRIGSTGRASGPHLDWRMNWLDRRVDPQPLLSQTDEAADN
ncbi:MAG: M23 family metallopeptidase [Xanthomonadales bacterium]|nr:M23 family metallopeptidase [Gammaproteobacteria bacterium]NNK04684.1 M23 family metallopeptidase [Xanthomonadales bacterium]